MLVPKSCLAAGLGKDGGFSKKAPDIRCLVSALDAGQGFSNPPVVSPRRKVGSCPGCESNWLCFSFRCRSVGGQRQLPSNYQPSISGGEVQNRGPQPPGLVVLRGGLEGGKRRSAACGGASKPLSRNPPKRCQWQKKRGGFEDGPRSAGALHLPIGWPDGEQKRHDWRPRQGPGIVLPQRWARIEIPLQCLSLTGRGCFSL